MFEVNKVTAWLNIIEKSFQDMPITPSQELEEAFKGIVDGLDRGKIRVASKDSGKWVVNQWAKKAILLYFKYSKNESSSVGPFNYFDKIPLKRVQAEFRAVPPSTVRYGAFVAPGAILMPSYVNIGAYVDSGTMVDTWATVGSCAQIGKNVHLSGGVGIGGVLEPLQSSPVIIEDGAFIGSRAVIVEGAIVEERAVLGANVVITGSSKIIDVTGNEPVVYSGRVPKNSVVIPGTYPKNFKAGEFGVPCALIIGQRSAKTDLKTSLNDVLRDFDIVC